MSPDNLNIEAWLEKSATLPVLDVRSPAEYNHAHIPGAYPLPLFSDEERKIVGTTYKQQGREKAIKTGVTFFNMQGMIETAEKILKQHQTKQVCVHCWRGGMRSGAVAWLLRLYGFEVYVLRGGYKAFRNWVLQQFEKDFFICVLGGYSGSGKTALLEKLKQQQEQIIPLETLASHKGSAFGGIGLPPQPTQEMFENLLAIHLNKLNPDRTAWIEDESQRIGALHIPHALWKTLRNKPLYFLDMKFEERLENIVQEYGHLNTDNLTDGILRIQKRLGPLETKTAIAELQAGNIRECFSILLKYYDKHYRKGLEQRKENGGAVNILPCSSVDENGNLEKLLSCTHDC